MILIKVIKASLVRAALFLHLSMTVWRVTVDRKDDIYWLMFISTIPFFIETFYTLIKRQGDDFLLFTPCFFFYLVTTIPCVWLLELHKTDVYLTGNEAELFNITAEQSPLEGLNLTINPNTWTIMIEELLLYLLIVGRWLLPRGEVSREQLSELLFAFIGIASDIMEMFSLFGETQVRSNRTLSYCLLAVWSLSVTQFCMTLTVTHQPRKAKNIKTLESQDSVDNEGERPNISHEVIAIMLSMMMQDIPFVTLRLYTIITYDLITYSLIFFTAKNCLVISLLVYKIAVLLQKRYCPENAHKEMINEDNKLYVLGDDHDSKKQRGYNHDSLSDSSDGSKEKAKMEKFYNESETGSDKGDNKGFDDNGTQMSENSQAKRNGNKAPNEKTPLTDPKFPAKDSTRSSSPDSLKKRSPSKTYNSKKTRPPNETGPKTPRTESTPKSPSKQQMPKSPEKKSSTGTTPEENQPTVSSGYGWVSSNPQKDNDGGKDNVLY